MSLSATAPQTPAVSAAKPSVRSKNPNFSCGPAAKRPGWHPSALQLDSLGRSHRSALGKARLLECIEQSKKLLNLPPDYLLGIVAGSDTGAMEMAMWSLLGQRPVDVFAWDAFGAIWVTDVLKQLKIKDARGFEAEHGKLPDLSQANFDHDVIFTWNGTSAGVKVPDASWIPADRKGLTICDATSAIFAMPMDWNKCDVITYSWQKVLGGEAAHGILILSPRAVERLESYKPAWPLPKLFRMTKDGKINKAIFTGETINTPSMLCIEDALDAMRWAESVGGQAAMVKRTNANYQVLADWVAKTPWVEFLCSDAKIRSTTSVTLKFVEPAYAALGHDAQKDFCKKLAALLEKESVGFDINGYRDAPPGLRIWCGATVEVSDLQALTAWIEWAFAQTKAALSL